MAGRIFLGFLRSAVFVSSNSLNLQGALRFYSQKITPKIDTGTKKAFESSAYSSLTKQIERIKIPTVEEINNDPNLKKQLIEMYKAQENDPEFQETTQYIMKIAMRKFEN